MSSFYIATTIGGGSQFTMLEVPATEKPKKGEYMLSADCVSTNIESGRFTDMTEQAQGAFGKVYVLTEDLEALDKY
jgi:hypothetical protein